MFLRQIHEGKECALPERTVTLHTWTPLLARRFFLFWPCRTPYRLPRSNGIAEAFVKTIKRDYVAVNPTPDAATVLAQLRAWFTDYNLVRRKLNCSARPSLSSGRRRSSMIRRSAGVNVKNASISKAVSSRESCLRPKNVDCQLSITPSSGWAR